MSEPQFVAETLAWCNEQRAKRGKKPLAKLPRGERGKSDSCPCGAATGISVHYLNACDPQLPASQRWFDIPAAVASFVRAFDDGNLPQYEAKQ